MAKDRVARGVRKVNETITQEGRALILTEAEADKLLWDDIPVGSIRINEKNGTWSVKIEGETGWVPGGIKNDGTLNVMKDTRIGIENFIIKQLEVPGSKREFTYYYDVADEDHIRHGIILYKNKVGMHGEYGQYGTFPTWAECKRRLLLEDDMQEMNYRNTQKVGYVFGLEKGDYALYRNHLKVFIDDILTRTVASGGIKEVSETRFCLTEENLENGMEITAEYIYAFRLGNPYPRTFINKNEPDEKAAEVGDFWLDIDGKVNDTDPLPDLIDEDGMVGWDRIRPTTRPTSLAGYGITDKVSYQGHKHQKSDIVDFPTSLPANGGRADVATRADKADTATTADSAKTATTAAKATTADRALKADTASKATTADSATNATTAGSANYATRAGSADKAAQADKATTADTATKATTATSATNADYATKAGSATSATNATKADSADTAKNANYAAKAGTATSATNATNATTATNATKATNDGSNRNIVNTYATKDELNSVQQAVMLAVPVGCILPYAGSPHSIPSGWKICDGKNGTPDLRDRFIVGAGGSFNINTRGGEITKKLTVDMLPEHRHTFFAAGSTDSDGHGGIDSAVQTISDGITGVAITNGVYDEKSPVGRAAGGGGRQSTNTGERTGSLYRNGTKNSGVNSNGDISLNGETASIQQGINIMPPYHALYYIMHTG